MVIHERGRFFFALLFTLLFLLAIWTVFALDQVLDYNLKPYGLVPRTWRGLRGLATIHFLHGDLKHIWQNTMAFAVLNTALFYFYRSLALRTFLILLFVPGILLWLTGRPDNHIGASVLIYGEAAFLFTSGLIRQQRTLMAVALIVAFYYGSLVWYLFPIDPHISWEGHLCGAVAGAWLAYRLRHRGPQRRLYNWEIEELLNPEETPDENGAPYGSAPSHSTAPNSHTIIVHYVDGKGKDAPEAESK